MAKLDGKLELAGVSPCRHIATLRVAQCRGMRRIVHCLNMLLRVQAPGDISHADRFARQACSLSRHAPYASSLKYAFM